MTAPTNNTPDNNFFDDPQLTAYALGELDPQSEAYQRIAARLEADPDLHQQIEAIQQLGSQLEQSYANASTPGLDEAAIDQLIDNPESENTEQPADADPTAPLARIEPTRPMTRRLLPYIGVAACTALVTAGVFLAMESAKQSESSQVDLAAETSLNWMLEANRDLTETTALREKRRPQQQASAANKYVDPVAEPTRPATPDFRNFRGFAQSQGQQGQRPTPAPAPSQIALDRFAGTNDKAGLGDPSALGRSPRHDDLGIAHQSLLNIEASTPFEDILTYPGEWPEVTASRLRGLRDELTDTEEKREDLDLYRYENERTREDSEITNQIEQRKLQEIQGHLRRARALQIEKKYTEAANELDAALFLDPDNAVVKALRDMIQDTALAVRSHELQRSRELTPEQQADQLINEIERQTLTAERERHQLAIEQIRKELDRRRMLIEQERRNRFAEQNDNPFMLTEHDPLSTFSVDVDTASYTYGRRAILTGSTLPQPDSVRIEEWINYFDYGYDAPSVDPDQLPNGRLTTAVLQKLEANDQSFVPFATHVEVVDCPWTQGNQLVRVGIKAMEVSQDERPPAHLVFLLDVSGSMNSPDKLGLVQQGLPLLLNHLNDNDKVSIVVYAGASGLVLEAAEAADKHKINEAIQRLRAGGSTAGAAGIQLAYEMAEKHFVTGGINRVILCTDGDFNVGTSNTSELVELVKAKANPEEKDGEDAKGVYLSVMGFGSGNLNDEMMEKITNAGNGNYAYIDSVNEAVKTMSSQAGGTLVTVAKDVKLQLEFNPAKVASYRLIGYENRVLKNEDFNNDTVDAGDIGAGHSVTALYEIVPALEEAGEAEPLIDQLRYQKPRGLADAAQLPELLTLKLRYKPVDAKAEQGTSRKVVTHVPAQSIPFAEASESTRFASSVAAMGMILRGSPYRGNANPQWVIDTASQAKQHDPHGYRSEFIQLATQVDTLQKQRKAALRGEFAE